MGSCCPRAEFGVLSFHQSLHLPLMSGHRELPGVHVETTEALIYGHPCGGSTRRELSSELQRLPWSLNRAGAHDLAKMRLVRVRCKPGQAGEGSQEAGPTRSPREGEKPALAGPMRRLKEAGPALRRQDGASAVQLHSTHCACAGGGPES